MEWQLGSAIGMYIAAVLFLAGAYGFAYAMDGILYDYNKFNENKKTIK